MKEFYSIANERIIKLIEQLSKDAKEIEKTLESDEEKGRVALNLLYYKIVLQGCIRYVYDVKKYVEKIQDCSIDESDFELILDKYCDNKDIPTNADIVLDENPKIRTQVSSVSGEKDIVLSENPLIKTKISEVSDDTDIILDENPKLNLKVSDVTGDNDIVIKDKFTFKTKISKISSEDNGIVLDENPPLNMNVLEVSDDSDIVLDENPELKLNVLKVSDDIGKYTSTNKKDVTYNKNDIILAENPPLNTNVLEVSDDSDIVLDENPELNINVLKVSDDIEKHSPVGRKVESPQKNDIVLDENPKINIKVSGVTDDEIPQKKDSKNLPLFGNLNFKVKSVSSGDKFDLESFNKRVQECRNKKNVKDNK